MAKGKSTKRDEKPAPKEGDYEFKLPPFDEKAFIRREVESAKASFWTLGIAAIAGILSYVTYLYAPDWKVGWLPILAAMALLRPMLQKIGFSDEVTQPKALIGGYFMLFFTALGLWILGVNLL